MNKTLLKLTGLFFSFSVIDVLVVSYWWLRCGQTQSSFYCDSFMFGGIFFILGIPGLILIGFALIILAFSKWYKGNVSNLAKALIIILGLIIFAGPYTPLLFPSDQPKTYRGFLDRMDQGRLELEKQKEQQCAEYRQRMSEYREGDPMPTPPSRECE